MLYASFLSVNGFMEGLHPAEGEGLKPDFNRIPVRQLKLTAMPERWRFALRARHAVPLHFPLTAVAPRPPCPFSGGGNIYMERGHPARIEYVCGRDARVPCPSSVEAADLFETGDRDVKS
jgi:hypothetical protein